MRKPQESLKNPSQSQVMAQVSGFRSTPQTWSLLSSVFRAHLWQKCFCNTVVFNHFDRNTNVLSMSVYCQFNFQTFKYEYEFRHVYVHHKFGLVWKCLSIGESCFLLNLPFGGNRPYFHRHHRWWWISFNVLINPFPRSYKTSPKGIHGSTWFKMYSMYTYLGPYNCNRDL